MRLRSALPWLAALVLYAAFALWYDSWRGPLRPEEIQALVERAESAGFEPEAMAELLAFLEADDGREFHMLNLIRLHPGSVALPGSEERAPASEVLERYTGFFLPKVFARAGHPVWVGPAAGGYVEHWGVEPNPGWTSAAIVRYRSRRDLAEAAMQPGFEAAHLFKEAAISHTLAFPVTPLFVGPRIWVPLGLALAAALLQLLTRGPARAPMR